MTAPVPISPPIPAEQRARALLAAHLPALQDKALYQAQILVEAAPLGLSPSQVRGLSNALAPGPQRRLSPLRLDELARYVAWREHRSTDHGPWHSLAPQIKQAVAELEQLCRDQAEQLRTNQSIVWQQHAQALQSALDWLEIEVLETFLHALERLATTPQDANRVSGGSSS